MEKNRDIKLIEAIDTWQGEGPDTGKRMLLLRFKFCNRKCHWCDTLIKMRAQQEFRMPMSDIQSMISLKNVGLMITGGEPTLPGDQLDSTIHMLNHLNYPFANIESNGLCLKELAANVKSKKVKFIYSPKIFNDGDLKEAYLTMLDLMDDPRVYMKLVYENKPFIKQFVTEIEKTWTDKQRVYLMPEGTTREEMLKNAPIVFDAAEKFQFNFSSREHIIYSFV